MREDIFFLGTGGCRVHNPCLLQRGLDDTFLPLFGFQNFSRHTLDVAQLLPVRGCSKSISRPYQCIHESSAFFFFHQTRGKPFIQSINQSISSSISKAFDQSFIQPIRQVTNRSTALFINQLINPLTNQISNHPIINQSMINRLTNQSSDHPIINQSMNQSTLHSSKHPKSAPGEATYNQQLALVEGGARRNMGGTQRCTGNKICGIASVLSVIDQVLVRE